MIGVLLAAVAVTKPVTSLRDIPGAVWTPILSPDPANPSVLSPASQPYSSAGPWGYGPMPIGGSFALNILVSGPVRVTVSSITGDLTSETVYDEVGTSFFEPVAASGGTWEVRITNEGTSSVEVMSGSNVIGQQRVTSYETVYPYVGWGSLVAALGVVLAVVGAVAKSKKRVSKSSVHRFLG